MKSATSTPSYETSSSKISRSASWSRSLLIKMMAKLQHGQLILQEGYKRWAFGKDELPRAHVIVKSSRVYRKVLFGGSIGAGEAYVDKLWEVDDLTALVRIMVLNMSLLDRMERGFAWLRRPFDLFRHLLNSNNKRGARRNILAHYDLGNDMYQTFLDPTMNIFLGNLPGRRK